MDILKLIEDCFITVDFMDLKNAKEDKFYYLTSNCPSLPLSPLVIFCLFINLLPYQNLFPL